MSKPVAISVDHVSKRYRLYHERNQSLKAAAMRGRRARYDEFWALDDVSFEVQSGQTFGIVGENGSGKSTLLKCMARILRPDRGEIVTHGKISALLELGAGFHPELSGRENVYLNGAILGLRKRDVDARFDEIVGFAGLEQFIDSPVKNYSSGMYVRLGFAVAISVDPEILLIDEVLAVGDAEFQMRCIAKVDDLRQQGRTIVIVTHSLETVRNLCDQVALIEHGVLHRVGPASEVVDEYLGDVFRDRVADGEHGQRWGSGEATITAMELLDSSGVPVRRVRSGDPVTLRFHLEASEQVERPVVGFAIYRNDGIEIVGSNTKAAGQEIRAISGKGVIDFEVANLLLLPGSYDLSGAVTDQSLGHAFDHRHRSFGFDVEPGVGGGGSGFVALPGHWNVTVRP